MLQLRSSALILLLTLQFGKSTFRETPFKRQEFLITRLCRNAAAGRSVDYFNSSRDVQSTQMIVLESMTKKNLNK